MGKKILNNDISPNEFSKTLINFSEKNELISKDSEIIQYRIKIEELKQEQGETRQDFINRRIKMRLILEEMVNEKLGNPSKPENQYRIRTGCRPYYRGKPTMAYKEWLITNKKTDSSEEIKQKSPKQEEKEKKEKPKFDIIGDIDDIEIKPPKTKKNDTKKKILSIDQLETILKKNPKNKNNEYLRYNKKEIEITPSKIYLLTLNKFGGYNKEIIADFSLKLLSKAVDYKNNNMTYYNFKANKNLFYNHTIENFLKTYSDKIYIVNNKYAIIKFIFNEKSKNIPEKKVKQTCGFDKGWYLPFVKDTDYTIMWQTDEQKEVLKNCEKIYKKYNDNEKMEIINMYRELIKITDMPKEYISIIISICIISPFKIYFIRKLGLFPLLILTGIRNAGKSDFLEVFSTDLFRDYEEYCSGDEAHSPSRLGDALTSSTFIRMIDDWENVDKYSVNTIKNSATGLPRFKRKRSDQTFVTNKREVSPLAITSQDLGDEFSDTANLSRAIVLNYEKAIKRNPEWGRIKNKLKKEKPFSLLYDFSKDWKNKDLDMLVKNANMTIDIDGIIKKVEKTSLGKLNVDKDYPRIREIYLIMTTGAYLFKEITGIKLPLKNVFETLIQARKNVTEEFLNEFISFCRMAKDYDDTNYRNPKFLTCELHWNMEKDEFYFTPANKRDYQEFTHSKIGIKPLYEKLKEALTDKSLIQYKSVRIDGRKPQNVMVIKDSLITGY